MDVTQRAGKITRDQSDHGGAYLCPARGNESRAGLGGKACLKIIEDNAEEQGQTYLNRLCGSFGDISAFSFLSEQACHDWRGRHVADR